MNKNLKQKIEERSVEKMVFKFLENFSKLKVDYAFTGGIAFGAYFRHLPRRSSDVDMVTNATSFPKIKQFLKRGGFIETTDNQVIKKFDKKGVYFGIDIHVDYLYLAEPIHWRILEKYSLKKALSYRVKLPIYSVDHSGVVKVFVVPPSYHFAMKLFPPLEPSNVHDLLYLTVTRPDIKKFLRETKKIIYGDRKFVEFFQKRISTYQKNITKNIWFKNLDRSKRKTVIKFWREIL